MSVAAYDRFARRCYETARALIAPDVRNSHFVFADQLRDALRGSGRWLDVGCGHDFLPPWMPAAARALDLGGWKVVGLDLDGAAIARHPQLRHRVIGNGEQLPFESNSFDLITANMVVEHVVEPTRLFVEMTRVLAPGGRIVLHTPNVGGYTTAATRLLPDRALAPLARLLSAREAEDVYPTYYRANSAARLATLAIGNGLVLERCELLNSSPQTIRIPPLMLVELFLLRAMRAARMARFRACLLAIMCKPAGTMVPAAAGNGRRGRHN